MFRPLLAIVRFSLKYTSSVITAHTKKRVIEFLYKMKRNNAHCKTGYKFNSQQYTGIVPETTQNRVIQSRATRP
jgi:hypothetical protein